MPRTDSDFKATLSLFRPVLLKTAEVYARAPVKKQVERTFVIVVVAHERRNLERVVDCRLPVLVPFFVLVAEQHADSPLVVE